MNATGWRTSTTPLLKATLGLVVALQVLVVDPAHSQERKPVVKPNYAQAERYSSRYLRQFVYDTSVRPRWIGKTDEFWYSYRTSQGTKYYRVDPRHATKEALFDHGKLAALLSEMLRKPLDAERLPLSRVEIDDDGTSIKFVVGELQYEYDLEQETLAKLGKAPARSTSSRFRRSQPNAQQEDDKESKQSQNTQTSEEEKKKDVGGEKNAGQEKGKKGQRKRRGRKKQGTKQTETVNGKQKVDQEKSEQKKDDQDKNEKKKDEKKKDEQKKDEQKKDEQKQTGEKTKREKKDDGDETKKDDGKREDKKEKADAKKPAEQTDHRSFSPDRTAYVYAKGYNLYFVEIPEGYKYEKPDTSKDEKNAEKAESSDEKSDMKDEKTETKGAKKKDAKKKGSEKSDTDKKDDAEKKGTEKKDTKTESDEKKGDEKKKEKTETDSSTGKSGSESDDEDEEKELPIPDIGPDLDGTAIQITKDGVEKFSFAGRSRSRRGRSTTMSEEEREKAKTRKTKPNVTWSKDSKAFYVSRRDSRKVKELFVINSLSEPRPTLETYSYSMPGEENVSISHSYYFVRTDKKLVEIPKKWKHESLNGAHWKRETHELRFIRSDRLRRNVEFCSLDLSSGKLTCLIEDGFEAANISVQSPRYLKDSDEMIWFSERSGWAHFYLYDLDGNLKNPITSGQYRASRIVDVDEKNRLVYFTGNAREPGENIYNSHLYCVRLDGTGLTLLDPGNANHRSTLSPSKKYVVDNCSRVDLAPASVLRDAQGRKIMDLEQSDLSRLKEVGWAMPETFVVKAADGVTNLYGNIWKPFDFDPMRSYPVIAHVYPGPQMEGTSHTFSATSGNQQLAQLGFIVIQVGHRGGTPQRSKAYHSYGYFNLRDYGLADKKAAIEQLGQRFPWVDVERVGIYGHSGGGFMTAAALLREPYNDFFKVGVSTAGNHDNNIYNSSWSERYHGLKEVPVAKKGESGGGEGSSSQSNRSRTSRSAAPVSDYAAFGTDESDFFYENEGLLNQFGELELPSNVADNDGRAAFAQEDGQQKEKNEETQKEDSKGKEQKKSDGKDTGKEKGDKTESKTEKKQETRFEIRVPTNAELAGNLKGHLFLIHGEADNNVHPANTLRLVDALIKANKRFDMLYLPATRHGFGSYQPYVTQRMYEYFAEHLLSDYQSSADMSVREKSQR